LNYFEDYKECNKAIEISLLEYEKVKFFYHGEGDRRFDYSNGTHPPVYVASSPRRP
jgi:hypothetical protein